MAQVALITGKLRRQAVHDALLALDEEAKDRVRRAKNIVLKPDMGHYELQLAATHVDAVRGALDALRTLTDVPVVIADAGHYGTMPAFVRFGFAQLPSEYTQVTLRDLQEGETVEHVIQGVHGPLLMKRAKEAVHADVKISFATLKTHGQYGACMSVANWAEGTWIVPARHTLAGRVFTRAPWLSAEGNEGAHQVIAQLYSAYPADIAIIDGMLGMEGEGPGEGTAIHVGAVLAGANPVAVDAVGATLMGLDPSVVQYLDCLAREGKGTIDVASFAIPLQALRDTARIFQLPFTQKHLRS